MLIEIGIDVDVSIERAWAALTDFKSHTKWMRDAEEVTFVGPRRAGVGTAFDCLTQIGPFRTTDRMEVTEWDERHRVGVRHYGAFGGEGAFDIEPRRSGVRIIWSEELRFPWYFAGPAGEIVAKPILTAMWKGNLERLKNQLEVYSA